MSKVRVKPEPMDTDSSQPTVNDLADVAAAMQAVGPDAVPAVYGSGGPSDSSGGSGGSGAAASGGSGARGKDKDRAGSPSRGSGTGDAQRHGYAELLGERDALHKKLEEQKKAAADELVSEKAIAARLRTERDDARTKHDVLERKVNATGITNFSDEEQVKRFKSMMRAVDKAGGVDAVLATLQREDRFRKNQYSILLGMQGWEPGMIGVTEWKITDSRGQPKGMFSFTKIVPDPPEHSPTQLRIMCLARDTAGSHNGQHPEHSVPMAPVNFSPLFPSKLEAQLDKVMALDNVKMLFENAVERKAAGRGLTVNNYRNRLWEDTKREIWTKWNYKLGALTAYQTNKLSDTWAAGFGEIAVAAAAASSAAGSSSGSRKRKA